MPVDPTPPDGARLKTATSDREVDGNQTPPQKDRHVARFLAVGILNTLFGYTVYAAGILGGLTPPLALGLATCCGVVFNFFTTGRLVFKDNALNVFPRFVGGYALSYLFNVLLLNQITLLGIGPLLAQILALPPTVVVTFLLMKFVVFRR